MHHRITATLSPGKRVVRQGDIQLRIEDLREEESAAVQREEIVDDSDLGLLRLEVTVNRAHVRHWLEPVVANDDTGRRRQIRPQEYREPDDFEAFDRNAGCQHEHPVSGSAGDGTGRIGSHNPRPTSALKPDARNPYALADAYLLIEVDCTHADRVPIVCSRKGSGE